MNKIFAITGFLNYLFVIFLNAFTDLGHKIIIQNTIFKIYDGDMQIILSAVVNGLILLPFILLFSPSGFLADKFAKNIIMKYSSLFAIFITLFITLSYYQGWFFIAFFMTFLLATQSAIYAPAKYGYIKELVGDSNISVANGAVQAVTTVAILGGIIFYTVLFEYFLKDNFFTKSDILNSIAPLGWLLVFSSILEWFFASKLPNKVTKLSKKKFRIKVYINGKYLFKNLKVIKSKQDIFEAVLTLSLFWSISQVVLAIFGEYAKSELGIINTIYVQGMMALAGIGIVVGAIFVAKLSKYYINLGLVVVGSIGITFILFCIPLFDSILGISTLFILFGIFSSFLIVPLNSNIQYLSSTDELGITIAGNNFIQNIFMITFLCLTTIFAYFGFSAKFLFFVMGIVGIYMSTLVLKRYAVMGFWAMIEIIFSFRYKFIYSGLENIPEDKAVLLLGNHISWIDWILIQLPIKRRISFMIDKDIYNKKLFHYILKKGEAIPLSSKASKDAFFRGYKKLSNNGIVAIYPEGKISKDGKLGKFYKGYELIAKDYDGVIIPFYIDGIFGSIFSKDKKNDIKRFLTKREIRICFGKSLSKDIKVDDLRDKILVIRSL